MSKKCELIDLKLHNDDGYYFSAVYRHEDETGIYETTIPHIMLPIWNYTEPIVTTESSRYSRSCPAYINFGLGDLRIGHDKDGTQYITKTIEKKVKKMTLADIEKKLGYKIELVSGEE